MKSNKLIQSKKFHRRRPMIGVTVDAGDDGVVVTVSPTTLRIGRRSDFMIVGLAVGFIVLLAGEVKDRWVGGIIGVDADMLAELAIVMVAAAAIALEVFVTGSCVGDVWTCVSTGTAVDIDVTIVTRVGAVVGVLIDLLVDTMIVFVSRIGVDVLADVDTNMVAAAMTELEVIEARVSLEDSLFFC